MNYKPTTRLVLILLSMFILSIISQSTYANKYYFRNLQVEDGLSQNMVYTIMQDKQGFMWFGTQDGLNRYDGNNFKIYKKVENSPKSIGSNLIFSLFQNDDNIIWVGTAFGVYLYDPLYDSFAPLTLKTSNNESVTGIVRDIKKDRKGNIWLITSSKTLFCVTPRKELQRHPIEKLLKANIINANNLVFDAEDNVWIITYQQGLLKYTPKTGSLKQFPVTNGTDANNIDMNDIFLLNSETLLLGTTTRGVLAFNIKTETIDPLLEKDSENKPLFVRSIHRNSNGELWIGTESGIYIYNQQTKLITNLQHRYGDPYSISDNAIHSICQDREGGMWIGSYFGGVNYYTESYSRFEKYYPITGRNTISGKSISEFCEDDKQNIWIGTEDAGLNMFDPKTLAFKQGFVPANNIHALLFENNRLWVGSFSEGLYIINLRNNQVKSYKKSADKHSLNDNNIYSIYKDYSGTIWIGTMFGLHKYNEHTDDFERIQQNDIATQINDILEDHNGTLWFATQGSGVFSYNKYRDKWTRYRYLTNDNNSNMVTCLLEDSRKRLWLGTEGAGLCLYNEEKGTFDNPYNTTNGLPNNVIYKLIEDLQGNIWGSTNKGLFQIDQQKYSIIKYNHANGLLGDQFNYKSGLKSRGGKIYFGGIKGFVAFYPDRLWTNNILPSVVINSFQVYNKEVIPDAENSPLTQSITYTNEIDLPYSSSFFSIGFAALSYVSPQANHFAYKLEGKDKDWIYTDQLHKVTYSDLAPGNYIFRVKASNSDGLWNEYGISLKINILPPFYRTVWASIFYILLTVCLAYLILRYYTQKVNAKNKHALESLEISKEKELYNAKIEFFTNVTHEIRTPLSLIKSPLEAVMKHIDRNDANWENMSIIQRNTNRLLKLVNELLDFRKAESKGLEVNFVQVNIISLIRETADRFIPSMQLKGIDFDICLPHEVLYIDVDIEIFTKILSNLFNNALKHGRTYVKVSISTLDDRFKLVVSNDGNSIPDEYAEKIFDPFFKLDNNIQGSGLGLPFAKLLVELHKGSIYLNNKNYEETTFIVEIPIHQERSIQLSGDNIEKIQSAENIQKQINNEPKKIDNKKVILSVEDNEEFQDFLCKQLSDDYQVLKAQNGQVALEILSLNNIDLIISDIMMPIMDGLAFCKEVKMNLKFSHTPVILLTAKTSLQSKIDGLKIGADEYIEKPYSIDYLKARIENLLDNRTKIKESYKSSPELNYETIAHSKADQDFLDNLINIITSNLHEVDLDVDKLATGMNMSRATLYRKVKSISELTPNDFIRLIRLKKAAELLLQKEYRVNEIAFIVGFGSPSYFSKCFQKQFGVLPKDFEKIQKS